MAYKALYRTYRPQKFSEVIGQDHIVRTLQNALANGKISHAYLFSGPRGTGKTSVARIFAKALNCDNAPTSEPCGECVSCREIAESNNPDVVEIDAASNNGVDEIRDIRDKVKFLPGGSKYKIYIIDEVHMLSQGAFNALLKTLEEPPKHVIFILATTEPHKVLPTIISRCQRYDFKTLSVKEIVSQIERVSVEENFKISHEAVIGIAEAAEGGMRDALSYLDQANSFTDDEITIDDVNSVTGNLNYDKIIELARYFQDKDINSALKTINDLVIMGKEINKIVSGMLQFYRDILLYKNIDTSMFSKYIFEKQEFKKLVNEIDVNKIFYYVDILSEVQTKIKTSSTPNIYLDVAVIKMINVADEDINILKRLKTLEEKIINNSSSISNDSSIPVIENEKINTLEIKLGRVVSELSKMELYKLIDRVTAIEEKQTESKKFDVEDLSDIDERISLLKNNISNLQLQLNDIRKIINEKSDEIKQNFESSSVNDDIGSKINALEKELDDIKTRSLNITNSEKDNNLIYQINQLKDKISNIEGKVYKLMSGALANQNFPTVSKKHKNKINEGQIVLFGDEIVSINDFERPVKERFDFEGNQNEEILKTEEDHKEIVNNYNGDDQPSEIIKEENLNLSENIFTMKDFEKDDDYIKEETLSIEEPYNEFKVSDFESQVKQISPNKVNTNESEIIESPYSQLVRKINQEKELEPIKSFSSLEQKSKYEEISVIPEQKDEPIINNKYIAPKNMANDEYSTYSVTVVERILHSSRTTIARDDKVRIINLWKSFDKNVSREQIDIADLLQEGQVVAVGDKEFILIYPNSSLCNQVMKMKFKRESLKLLYDLLGDAYNYIALPEKIWNEKRTEYINQYNIGIRQPKLTPINDPTLNVEKENQEYISSQEKMVNKAMRLFGENIVKIE